MARVYDEITLGSRLERLELPGLCLSEVAYEPGTEMPAHAHRNPNVTLVLSGGFEETVEGRTYDIRSGNLVFKPAGTVHRNTYGGERSRSFLIEFKPEFGGLYGRRLATFEACRWLAHGMGSQRALQLYALFRRGAVPGEAALRDLLAGLFRVDPAAPTQLSRESTSGWLADARSLLESDEDELSVQQIADIVGLHPVHLARTFRSQLHCAPREYRQRWRVSRALQRLSDSDDPLHQVAQASGFYDQSHLCRSFQQQLGMTPGAYRRLVRSA